MQYLPHEHEPYHFLSSSEDDSKGAVAQNPPSLVLIAVANGLKHPLRLAGLSLYKMWASGRDWAIARALWRP